MGEGLKRAATAAKATTLAGKEEIAERFNKNCPVGTKVRFWRGVREGEGQCGTVRFPAEVLSGHTPVVWVVETTGCIALTHVEKVDDA